MKKIAITGSYASGKTHALSMLQEMGYPVFSSDEYVRNLYNDKKFQQAIWKSLGEQGEFDKEVIKVKILDDFDFRRKLEAFIHPLVKEGIKDFSRKYQEKNLTGSSNNLQSELLFFEVPLLFEAGMPEYFDKTICVYCSEETRKKRAMQKIGFSRDKFEAISKIQMSQEQKKRLADYALDSDKSEAEIKKDLNKLINLIDIS